MHVRLRLAIAICACPQILIGLDHLVVLMVPYGLGIDVICIYIEIIHERSIPTTATSSLRAPRELPDSITRASRRC
jgi:hypothetical protein